MKNLFFAILLLAGSRALASEVPVFDCWIGGRMPALQVASVTDGYRYSAYRMRIFDPNVCKVLNVNCPFDSLAYRADSDLGKRWAEKLGYNPKYLFVAVKGKYMEGVALLSDGAGMKAVALKTDGNPGFNFSSNWYFHPGQCIGGY